MRDNEAGCIFTTKLLMNFSQLKKIMNLISYHKLRYLQVDLLGTYLRYYIGLICT